MRNYFKTTLFVLFTCGMECSAQSVSGQAGGYDYVDLGLPSGTKWATYNVGATKPIEFGDYFAWGETTPKEDYSWSTYKWSENKKLSEEEYPEDFTKYCTDSSYGIIDNKRVLEAIDDAATVNWGGDWRMPTSDEIKELIDCCRWTWSDDYRGSGVKGIVGASIRRNGYTIFFPAAGVCYGTDINKVGVYGQYWSSSLYNYSNDAYLFYFLDMGSDWSYDYRSRGRCVRAVFTSKKYTVNFYGSDSTLISSQIVEEGKQPSTVKAPAVEGYFFSGWSEYPYVEVTEDMDIYAKYIKNEDGKNGVTVSGKIGNYTFVDLGLSVKWATYNVGASQSFEYGNYFAWGETTPKENYNWSTYLLCDGNFYDMIKYCINGDYGTFDNKDKLEKNDDAATVNWGKDWRMPTNEEIIELMRSCRWAWRSSFNDTNVSGYLGTSSVNGATIFLPACGRYKGNAREEVGSYGYYWASEVSSATTYNAYDLYFYSNDVKRWDDCRNYGQSVRAVSTAEPTRDSKIENQALMVYAVDGALKIFGCQTNTNIQVFDMNGKVVKSAVTDGNGNADIALSASKGVYVVTVGNQSTKIMLK